MLVFDSNPDALMRRHGVFLAVAPDAEVVATPSRTAVLVLAAAAEPATPALVDLCVTDRVSLDRPGERLVERLVRGASTSHIRAIAWSAHIAPEVIDGARRAGAHAFVTATLRREREADELQRVLNGEAVWPQTAADADWESWFERSYAMPWKPWMEPILVRLAGSGERKSVAAELVSVGAARSSNHAAARMRDVARAIAGEVSNSPPVVARRAAVVLALLAAHRPLSERPAMALSLDQGAEQLRQAPSLAVAAGLNQLEIDDLLALDQLIRNKREGELVGAGAPPADRVRGERLWAAGRRALEHGANVDDIDAVIEGVVARVEDALVAIEDACEDERVHPAPRAAAALTALEAVPELEVDGVHRHVDGRVTWSDLTASELALDDTFKAPDLRRFTAAADAALVAGAPAFGRQA